MAETSDRQGLTGSRWFVDKLVNVGIAATLASVFSVAGTIAVIQSGLVDLGTKALPDLRKAVMDRLDDLDSAIERADRITDMASIERHISRNRDATVALKSSVDTIDDGLQANVERFDALRTRIDDRTDSVRRYVETRADRIQRALESRFDQLKDKQADDIAAVMAALDDLADERSAGRRAMERLFDDLVAQGERAIAGKDANRVLEWMTLAMYVVVSLEILEQEGLLVDRSIAKTDLKRAVARFRERPHIVEGRDEIDTVMIIVRAVRELARTGRI